MNLSETENAARPDGSAGTPGTLLSEARQAQNLSVADVARQLRLSVQQVEALEAGDYEKLPGAVFVRGFLRNYARLLKLDPERLVHSAVKNLPEEEQRPAAPPSHDIPFPSVAPRRWPRYAAIIAAVVAALAAYEFFLSDPQPAATRSVAVPSATPGQPAAQTAAPPENAPAPAPAAGQAEPPAAQPGAAPAGEGSAPGVAPTSAQEPAPADKRTAAADGRTAAAEADGPRNPGEREVRMVFSQESWVEIRDRSGKAVFSQLNRRGTEKRVNARPPLAVIVGNSQGVRFIYDDQPVDLAQHTKVDVARFNLE